MTSSEANSLRERVARQLRKEAAWFDDDDTGTLGPAVMRKHAKLLKQAASLILSEPGSVGELVEALRPFAKDAETWDDDGVARYGDDVELWQCQSPRTKATIGNLRRARTALAHTEGRGGGS